MNIADDTDERHLRILSICQYVAAGISLLESCCPLFGLGLGIAITVGIPGDANPPPPEFGMFLSAISALVLLFSWGYCLLELYAAYSLSRHKNYRLCFVMACLELLDIPLGTILGVFEIIVLSRPSVKALYEGRPYRHPRRVVLDDYDDDGDDAPAPPASKPGSESIQERPPSGGAP